MKAEVSKMGELYSKILYKVKCQSPIEPDIWEPQKSNPWYHISTAQIPYSMYESQSEIKREYNNNKTISLNYLGLATWIFCHHWDM